MDGCYVTFFGLSVASGKKQALACNQISILYLQATSLLTAFGFEDPDSFIASVLADNEMWCASLKEEFH